MKAQLITQRDTNIDRIFDIKDQIAALTDELHKLQGDNVIIDVALSRVWPDIDEPETMPNKHTATAVEPPAINLNRFDEVAAKHFGAKTFAALRNKANMREYITARIMYSAALLEVGVFAHYNEVAKYMGRSGTCVRRFVKLHAIQDKDYCEKYADFVRSLKK